MGSSHNHELPADAIIIPALRTYTDENGVRVEEALPEVVEAIIDFERNPPVVDVEKTKKLIGLMRRVREQTTGFRITIEELPKDH